MKVSVRYVLAFAGAAVVGIYLHELGHAVAGWVQGIGVFPSPAKEYILRPHVYWNEETWIALGGVLGTIVATLGAILYFLWVRTLTAEAVLFGALLPAWVYTIRFLLMGRGHDETEWQAAQAALSLAPAGHAIDILFVCLSFAGIILWARRWRSPVRYAFLRILCAIVGGAILLVALQVTNNRIFDRFFPSTQVVNPPSGLDPR